MELSVVSPSENSLPAAYRFLLEPVTPEAPCGEDLEYDPRYMELFIRIVPREKKVIGGNLGNERLESELEPVRWSEVERDCLEVLARTRDVRLLTVWLRCRVQQAGAMGLRQGLLVLDGVLRRWPEAVYPRLESEGEPDLLPRSDALLALAENRGLLADIRGLTVAGTGGLRLEMRDVERSFSLPLLDDALSPEVMRHRLEDLRLRGVPDYLALLDCLHLARSIDHGARALLGAEAPDLGPLLVLLARLETAASGEAADAAQEPAGAAALATPVSGLTAGPESDQESSLGFLQEPLQDVTPGRADRPSAGGAAVLPNPPPGISSRHMARERIREVRLWFEEHEPSSPVPVLLRQAEQLVGRRFADLVHCLPDELLERWDNE